MGEIGELKKQIFLYGILVIAVCQIISLFILGWDRGFFIGILTGYAIAVINFNILAYALKKMVDSGNPGYSTISFVIRMLLYCIAFYFCITKTYPAGVGCLLGFLSLKGPMYYLHAIKPKFNTKRKIRPEVREMYEEEDRRAEDEYYGREE